MNVIQRYIFRRMLGSFAFAFPALTIVIWLSQALRELSLVTEQGQNAGVFFQAVLLFLPGLVVIIGPVALLIVVISTVNGLNNDSELVSLAASGSSQKVMLRPILALAVPVALLSALCSTTLNPMSARATTSLLDEVNADVIGSIIRPGQFRTLGDDVVMQVAAIQPDGTLEGIFVYDERENDETVAYLAGAGATVEAEDGHYLLMRDGVIQRRKSDGDVTVIRFQSYAFDLSSLGTRTEDGRTPAVQRDLGYLLSPDPNDPEYQDNPFSFTAELHSRLTIPLYVLVLALLPLAMLGQVQSARQRRGGITAVTALLGIGLVGAGLTLGQALPSNATLLPLAYAVPLAGILIPAAMIYSGRRGLRLRLPRLVGRGNRVGAMEAGE